jgi:Protein phosphatase 2C
VTPVMSHVLIGGSAIGPLHVQMNLPCQDAYAFEVWPPSSAVIAVADGLGSAARSEIGARLAVEAAVQTAREELLRERDGLVTQWDTLLKTIVHSARLRLEERATQDQCSLRDLATTLIVVVFAGDCVGVGQIGDGGVVAKTDGNLTLLSGPQESEYANEVVPLTSTRWEDSFRVIAPVVGVRSAAVFTDGCQRAALRKSPDRVEPFDRFFEPIFSYALEVDDPQEANAEIRALLCSKKLCDNSEDDKTLVIATVKPEHVVL